MEITADEISEGDVLLDLKGSAVTSTPVHYSDVASQREMVAFDMGRYETTLFADEYVRIGR